MAHKHKHTHDAFIPSPFPAVNEYEKEFAKLGTEMIANATDSVLKEIAKMTADLIKETKE